MDQLRDNPLVGFAAVAGVLMLVLGGVVLLRGAGDAEEASPSVAAAPVTPTPDAPPSDEAAPATEDASTSQDGLNPDVAPLNCARLLTQEERDTALGVWEREDGPGASLLGVAGETCTETIDGEERFFVRLEPGNPDDLAPGASLLGGTPEPVDGVGDEAVWFAGVGADDHAGALAVRAVTALGDLHVRITLGRPDLDDGGRLELVRALATAALPRFPGVEVVRETVVLDPPPPEPPATPELVLRSRVASGEWSEREGLVTMLAWMVGDLGADAAGVEGLAEVASTGVLEAAEAFLEEQPDDEEVAALVSRLTLTGAELEQMSSSQETLAAGAQVTLASHVPAVTPVQQREIDLCDEWLLEPPCFDRFNISETDEIPPDWYVIYAALRDGVAWTVNDVRVVAKALRDAAPVYERIGTMPRTSIVLLPNSNTLYVGFSRDDGCSVKIGESYAGTEEARFTQIVAREIAYCLMAEDLFDLLSANQGDYRWLVDGLANYLSGVVYPNNNLEHENLPNRLASVELSAPVPARRFTNWIIYEHLHDDLGPTGIIDLIRGFPVSGDLVTSFATAPGIDGAWFDLARDLTDERVRDVGIGTVPYDPPGQPLTLSGPVEIPVAVPRLLARRLQLQVPDGQYACVDGGGGADVRMAWRPGIPGTTSSTWSEELPDSFQGESVLVLTSVAEGATYDLEVTYVGNDPTCGEDEEPPSQDDPAECPLEELCGPSGFYFWTGRGG